MYKVEIKSTSLLLGAKESTHTFNDVNEAIECFNSKCKWLGIGSNLELLGEQSIETQHSINATLHNSDGYKISICYIEDPKDASPIKRCATCGQKAIKGKHLNFINRILANGKELIGCTGDMSFLDEREFYLNQLSITEKTFIAAWSATYIVTLK